MRVTIAAAILATSFALLLGMWFRGLDPRLDRDSDAGFEEAGWGL